MKAERLADIALVVLDCDGVLTDGRLIYSEDGRSAHAFHVRDGLAMIRAQHEGVVMAVISGRASSQVARRLRELRVQHIYQSVDDKAAKMRWLADHLGLSLQQCAFVGDDVNDLPAMRLVALPVAVADAADEVREYVSRAGGRVLHQPGGHGAVRELLQDLLRARGCWAPELGEVP